MNGAIEGAGWAVLWQAWDMFLHFFLLSFMAVGGAMTVAPDMHANGSLGAVMRYGEGRFRRGLVHDASRSRISHLASHKWLN